MARHASTYRQARRQAWLAQKPVDHENAPMDWIAFNYATKEQSKKQGYGSAPTVRVWADSERSKYVPHIGAKQRAKGASK